MNTDKHSVLTIILLLVLIVAAVLSMRYGAVNISLDEIGRSLQGFFSGAAASGLNERIFMDIRLPRVLLCMITGAGLATGGTLLQALFRNPIIEPGLIGTSSGAAFGAALYFVLGASFQFHAGEWTLPIAASLGGILATSLVLVLARSRNTGKTSVIGLLLTGIAVNALFMSGVGFLSYIARDPQARSITFWGMGTLSGANWHSVMIVGTVTTMCIMIALLFGKQLNALALGEEEAQYLGVDIRRLKVRVLLVNVVMIAVSTSFTGVISFVGLIVPHLLRVMGVSDNRKLLRTSALMGAIILTVADLIARMALRPAELPIGIVTSLVGVPVFIVLLRSKKYFF